MSKEKLILLNKYLEYGFSPLLIENFSYDLFQDAVILNSDCDVSLLNGHYKETNFVPPLWYSELEKKDTPILIIKDLNKISLEEQTKFIEIFKYKKISTFDLPKNCVILATVDELKKGELNEDVYSLMVHI